VEPIRETFWNIPKWAEIGQYVLGFLTIAVFLFGAIRRVRKWRQGQPEKRTDQLGRRFVNVFNQAILQIRTAKDPYPGIMHLSIFWGMVTLFIGTALATVDWDVTKLFFDFQFLKGGIYVVYELALDIMGLLLALGLGMALYRRYVVKPARLEDLPDRLLKRDDLYVLVILAFITITGYLVEGLRIAVDKPDWAAWSPVGNAIAYIFTAMGDPTNGVLHLSIWIIHVVVSFGALISIPFTKLFHIVSVPTNIFFSSLQPAGALAPLRDDTSIGVKEWTQFSWKQILDFESCTRCGRCQDVCPAFASGMTLSPRNMMIKLEKHLWEKANGRSLLGDVITPKELWACTTCRACVQVCPAFIDHLSSFVDMRRYLVNEGEVDTQLQDALANLGRYGNSFGQSDRMRAKWTQPIQPKVKDVRRESAEYLWFVGDYASYNASLTEVTQTTASVFHKAGLDFGILYESERNAGNDARRVGEEGLFEMLAERNTVAFSKSQFQKIITTDPHTYNTLKNEYPAKSAHPVLHYSELLDQLITSGKLNFTKKLGYKVTFHDPCYLGRYNGVYDAPRRVIAATGCELIEMPRCRENSYCCGAGGGRIWMDEGEVKERPSEARIHEAAGLDGVQIFVVACPKDITMYRDAVKTTGKEDRIVVKDLIELVNEAL
jgi:Fe-S oxidoreductase/nitrate reductase gamma subunit